VTASLGRRLRASRRQTAPARRSPLLPRRPPGCSAQVGCRSRRPAPTACEGPGAGEE
jgi:hypothetical protein